MLIIKGIIIGIGKIIPGVSGSMLAISLGIYQQLIDSINSFFKEPKRHIKFLSKIGIGVLVAILIFSKLIIKSLNYSYIITIFFFIGLIIGSINDIKPYIEKKNNYISIIIFILILILGLLNVNNKLVINNKVFNFLFYILVGIVDAITMIIPGISGTATLMMIGAYNTVINSISNITNLNLVVDNIKILIPFAIGMIIGVILTAKLIDYLFKNFKNKTYSAILGFTTSTVVLMAIKCLNTKYSLSELITSFILLFIGLFITKTINKFNN